MENINELIFRVNNNLRNNTEIEKSDIKLLLNIAIETEKQLHKNAVSCSLPADLINYVIKSRK